MVLVNDFLVCVCVLSFHNRCIVLDAGIILLICKETKFCQAEEFCSVMYPTAS